MGQTWFWYIPALYGSEYNDSVGSNCTTHPCFNYTLKKEPIKNTTEIKSGNFNGVDYSLPSRGGYRRTGVKLYR